MDYDKQSYILCNVMEVAVLVAISFTGLTALARGEVSIAYNIYSVVSFYPG